MAKITLLWLTHSHIIMVACIFICYYHSSDTPVLHLEDMKCMLPATCIFPMQGRAVTDLVNHSHNSSLRHCEKEEGCLNWACLPQLQLESISRQVDVPCF